MKNRDKVDIFATGIVSIGFFVFMRKAFHCNLWVSIGTIIMIMLVLLHEKALGLRYGKPYFPSKAELIGALKMAIILIWGFILYLNLESEDKYVGWILILVFTHGVFGRKLRFDQIKTNRRNKKLW